MSLLHSILEEVIGFFGVNQFIEILEKENYTLFLSYEGIVALLVPIIPLLILLELILGFIYKKPQTKQKRE